MPPSRQRGFTLIELLTVITIIGILIGLSFVGVSAARNQVKKTVTTARFSTYIKAIKEFEGDYGYFPQFNKSIGDDEDLLFGGDGDEWIDFWKTLYALDDPSTWNSGKKERLPEEEAKKLGNKKRREYLQPNDDNHYLDSTGEMNWETIRSISPKKGREIVYVAIDLTGDGKIPNPNPKTQSKRPYLNTRIAFFAIKKKDEKMVFQTWK